MKLPVLRVHALPNLYKHCSNVRILHIDMAYEGQAENIAFIESYLQVVREQIYRIVASFFITSQATCITSQKDTYVIFKTNTDKKILLGILEALFAEVDQYCEHVTIQYQYMDAMLFVDGTPVKILRSSKLGEDFKQSVQYAKCTTTYDHKKKPRGKQLPTLEEYRTQYEKITQHPSKTPKNERTQPSSMEYDGCEYYI